MLPSASAARASDASGAPEWPPSHIGSRRLLDGAPPGGSTSLLSSLPPWLPPRRMPPSLRRLWSLPRESLAPL
eukprot:14911825-Alexandrium_andersonii.AAC.1